MVACPDEILDGSFDMRAPSIRKVGTTQVQQKRFYVAGGVDDGTTLTPSALLEVTNVPMSRNSSMC
jgi:hypothetical protein